ncbi:MAG: 8-amino-7-oxononanoate synthase [Oscillatoriales cyanobacterium]|uniref:8-amino-7-ketopelargonate synthase n=1 Tax=Microcoleus anatoxicus PTRS2 TaxID=2705321 RepID=A0ABU8YRL4_9CYAN|nr:MAG: 8-amino-7-oxononanoate synthase [Oscillatoriales cyanobacterium]TAD93709.1 MAG: 8-amino-7-oxononanoate synthase [Oscillatoriales cyanobacterium]TAD99864.1 MAG: 8-amino-7-oxononanoate synthase [Oscillatoriales cyanobacterium]TAF02090.1 MAG: 8-amino-7-oxononanoate synthase [Oscillatoriales cyanobacterium]TAF32405.1 MAG: 8-amino-7-oxononanoate synthase [Oscillatoriales cyanobacterium]
MNADPYAWIEKDLDTIYRANWYRSPQSIESCPGPRVKLAGDWLINFASNDYLGLAGDDRLIQAAMAATQEFGTGTTGSRLVGGHRDLHRQLEQSIANLKQTEDALVFSSGYLANLGAIASLVGKRDLILSDKYNHSSLKNGATLSQAQTVEYDRCNVEDVRALLTEHRDRYRKCLIVTDSVFSMDGDLCPLPQLLAVAKQFNCMVLVDEAHATGVLGARGAGCVEHFGCTGETLIQVGTLSKALGSLGGYVAADAAVIDFLRNRAPTWIYTTGLTPADTAAALEAVKIVQQEPDRRRRLQQNIQNFRDEAIANYQLPITNSLSPIFSFPLKDAATALTASSKLKEMGIFAPAIRPPTVSVSRIRISLMATHELAHLQHLAKALAQI